MGSAAGSCLRHTCLRDALVLCQRLNKLFPQGVSDMSRVLRGTGVRYGIFFPFIAFPPSFLSPSVGFLLIEQLIALYICSAIQDFWFTIYWKQMVTDRIGSSVGFSDTAYPAGCLLGLNGTMVTACSPVPGVHTGTSFCPFLSWSTEVLKHRCGQGSSCPQAFYSFCSLSGVCQ